MKIGIPRSWLTASALILTPVVLSAQWGDRLLNRLWYLQLAQQAGSAPGPSIADAVRRYNAELDTLNTDIVSARTRFAAQYPSGASLSQARATLTRLLDRKDGYYFQAYLTARVVQRKDDIESIQILDGTRIDGGIPAPLLAAFFSWAAPIGDGMGGELGNFQQRLFAQMDRLEGSPVDTLSTDPNVRAYSRYRVYREWYEVARAGKVPQGLPADGWKMITLSVARMTGGSALSADMFGDVYDAGLKAALSPLRYAARCPIEIGRAFPGADARTCDCIESKLVHGLDAQRLWDIESSFTNERLLLASTWSVNLHKEVAKCL